MAKPFTLARALTAPSFGDIVLVNGYAMPMFCDPETTGETTELQGNHGTDSSGAYDVMTWSLTFNTGFVDANGNEIFTGDFLNCTSQSQDNNWIVYFDEGDGRFNTSITDVFYGKRACRSNSNINIMSDKNYKLLCTNVTYIDALDRERAKSLFIVGNIYDKLLAGGDFYG